jgi:8-amino-7-oxononanoate synthase
MTSCLRHQSSEEIQNWLVMKLAELAQVNRSEIDVNDPFAIYGTDSISLTNLAGDLSDWLHRPIFPGLFYDYPSISVLAIHLGSNPIVQSSEDDA